MRLAKTIRATYLSMLFVWPTFWVVLPATTSSGDFVLERDVDRNVSRVLIPAENGKVSWADVLEGIGQVERFDLTSVRRLLPGGSLDLDQRTSRLTLRALNLALS